ncbi:ribosomal protein S6 kinase alpha-6 [Trichonephila clavata]|nr:ribosomal protein S6 kinase alpha-6 [Trichonephila clavata]
MPTVLAEKTGVSDQDLDADMKREVITPKDFENLKVLGSGGFGKVLLVRKKSRHCCGKLFAMKIIKKNQISDGNFFIEHTKAKAERDILVQIKHPFIVHLYFAFQSTKKLYLVIDFCSGGDFFNLLEGKRNSILEEDSARYSILFHGRVA